MSSAPLGGPRPSGPLRTVDASVSRMPAGKREASEAGLDGSRAVDPVDRIDTDAGWPPRSVEESRSCAIPSVLTHRSFTVPDRRSSIQAALANPEVEEFLEGRWEVLGAALVHERGAARSVRHRVRVCVFNYTDSRLVEVYVEDGEVVSVEERAAHEHPEAPVEMAQAIAVARADPSVRDRVSDLVAHAILQVPTEPHEASSGHRCMVVMFTESGDPHRELPVRYSAIVDLRLQRVVASGPAPCAKDTASPPAGG